MSVWVYEVVEVHDRRGHALGKYRLVRWQDDHPEDMNGLCKHVHDSAEEALHCPDATLILNVEFRERPADASAPRTS